MFPGQRSPSGCHPSLMVRVVSCLAISELPLPLRDQLQRKLHVRRALACLVSDRSVCTASSAPGDDHAPELVRTAVDDSPSLSVVALK